MNVSLCVGTMDKILEVIKYIILGFVQGVAEILPISSSGHLLVFKQLLNVDLSNNVTFEVLLHFASLLALLIFFRKRIIEIIKDFFNN